MYINLNRVSIYFCLNVNCSVDMQLHMKSALKKINNKIKNLHRIYSFDIQLFLKI